MSGKTTSGPALKIIIVLLVIVISLGAILAVILLNQNGNNPNGSNTDNPADDVIPDWSGDGGKVNPDGSIDLPAIPLPD